MSAQPQGSRRGWSHAALLLLALAPSPRTGHGNEAGFPARIEQHGQALALIGSATFRYGLVDLYRIALYRGVDERRHRHLEIRYLIALDAEQIVTATEHQLERQLGRGEFDRLKPRLDRLHEAIVDVAAGDRFALTVERDGRVTLSHNGVVRYRAHDPEFGERYLGIWLGERPIDAGVRRQLLRGDGGRTSG